MLNWDEYFKQDRQIVLGADEFNVMPGIQVRVKKATK